MLNHFGVALAGLCGSKGDVVWKNVKLTGEASSGAQEAAEEFKNYFPGVIQEREYVEEQVFNADKTFILQGHWQTSLYNTIGLQSSWL